MLSTDKIYIAGHNGMVGSAIFRKLKKEGYDNILTMSSADLDLRDQRMVNDFFNKEKPAFVFLAAAKVGGIAANNNFKAEFLYDNLMIETNIIHAAWQNKVTKLLFLGSSCIYPRLAPQPLKEEYLLTGSLETTNEAYAIAKIAGVKMCAYYREQYGCNYISAMPTNLYGPNDNYDLQNAHVLPALIRKFSEAKRDGNPSVTVWGSGSPKREFLHVDDLAEACYFLMLQYDESSFVNIGTGEDISIKDLALLIKHISGYTGELIWDDSKPDGTPRKLMDVSRINELGWKYSISLEDGIRSVYDGYTSRTHT